MTHGNSLAPELWQHLMKVTLLQMLQLSTDMYLEASGDPAMKAMVEAGVPTPSFAPFGSQSAQRTVKNRVAKRKMNFDDEAVMSALSKNTDEQWEETACLLAQTVIRALKKYQTIACYDQFTASYTWEQSIKMIQRLIKGGTTEILSEIYKALEEFICEQTLTILFSNRSQLMKLFEVTSTWLMEGKTENNGGAKKPQKIKLCPIIIAFVKELYTKEIVGTSDGRLLLDT